MNVTTLPFFKAFGPILYHGSSYDVCEFSEFKYRASPRDTCHSVHHYANKILTNKFGIPVRSLTFASMDQYTAKIYGSVKIIFPLGNDYRLFASKTTNDFSVDLALKSIDVLYNFIDMVDRIIYHDDKKLSISDNRITYDSLKDHFYTYEGDIDLLFTSAVDLITVPEEMKDKVINGAKLLTSHIKERIHDYVDSVIEIKDSYDIAMLDHQREIMLYYPDGITEVKLSSYDELISQFVNGE